MQLSEYRALDGVGLAELIKTKQISPKELLDTAWQAVEKVNPQLNFLCMDMRREAEAQLKDLDINASPLAGVPILLKDLLLDVAGWPTQSGLKALSKFIPGEDSALAAAYRRAGLVFAGKTTLPELGLHPFTESAFYGITRNPWDTSRTPGGSSGGSGAAVAAGAVPIGHGGDGGGSIRIPAAHCGLVGLKPSRGLVSNAPLMEVWGGLVVQHALTRSVRDSAAMLDIAAQAAGIMPDMYAYGASGGFYECLKQPLRRLKIAYTDRPFLGGESSAEARAALQHAVKLMAEAGHQVEEARPPLEAPELLNKAVLAVLAADLAALKIALSQVFQVKLSADELEPATWAVMRLGHFVPADQAFAARQLLLAQGQIMAQFHQRYDILLTPTMPVMAPKIGELRPSESDLKALKVINTLKLHFTLAHNPIFQKNSRKLQEHVGFTMPFNCTGQPAINLPLYWHNDTLPIGVQCVAAHGQDALLLQLAQEMENLAPWAQRRAPVDITAAL